MEYPKTEKKPITDIYFNTEIIDNYRWLEDDMSKNTQEWVKRQNKFTNKYLDQIPFRKDIQNRLSEMWNYEKISAPFKRGSYTYFYKNNGLQNQYVIWRKNKEKDEIF